MSNPKADFVLVLRSDYVSACVAAEKLSMLEAGGVDNWEGYDDSMSGWRDIRKAVKADIDAMPAVNIVTCEECEKSEPHCNWREAGARFCGLGKRRDR